MIGGICWIKFKDIPDEKIQEIITEFWQKNKDSLEGMTFNQLKSVDALRNAEKLAMEYLHKEK